MERIERGFRAQRLGPREVGIQRYGTGALDELDLERVVVLVGVVLIHVYGVGAVDQAVRIRRSCAGGSSAIRPEVVILTCNGLAYAGVIVVDSNVASSTRQVFRVADQPVGKGIAKGVGNVAASHAAADCPAVRIKRGLVLVVVAAWA